MIAYNTSSVSTSYAIGDVTVNAGFTSRGYVTDSFAGGLSGYNSGTIGNCYATGKVITSYDSINASNVNNSAHSYAGGLVANNAGNLINCYAVGYVTSASSTNEFYCARYAGGLTAKNSGTVANCYRFSGQSILTKNEDTSGSATSLSNLQSESFHVNSLAWSLGDWSFTPGTHPKLKSIEAN